MATPKRKLDKVNHELACVQFQLDQQSDFESGKFRGIASVFGSVVDTFPNRTRFRRGAFARTIADRASRIKILLMHNDRDLWIGLPTMLAESGDGLLVEASLNNTQGGQDVMAALRHAAKLGKLDAVELSIGFDVLNHEMVEDEETEELFREVTEARLWEISVVNFGADRQTKLLEAANKKLEDDDEPEKLEHKKENFVVPSDVSKEIAEEGTSWSRPTLSAFTDKSWSELSDSQKRRIAQHAAWARTMPPEGFGDIKLWHHRPSDGAVVPNAVRNALARLSQTQGLGPDREKVEAHLRAHLARIQERQALDACDLDIPVDSEWFTKQIDALMLGIEQQGEVIREQFVGKKISKKNIVRLREAMKALQELLDLAEPALSEEEESHKALTEVEEWELELAEAGMRLINNTE